MCRITLVISVCTCEEVSPSIDIQTIRELSVINPLTHPINAHVSMLLAARRNEIKGNSEKPNNAKG